MNENTIMAGQVWRSHGPYVLDVTVLSVGGDSVTVRSRQSGSVSELSAATFRTRFRPVSEGDAP